MAIISIDFDGTIMNPDDTPQGQKLGKPFFGAKEALEALRKKGHKLVIYTLRGNEKYIRDWFKFFEIPFDEVTKEKPDADLYVDNKAVRFNGDWNMTLLTVKMLLGNK